MYHNRLVADVNVIRKEKQQRSSICMFIYFISHEHFITTCGCWYNTNTVTTRVAKCHIYTMQRILILNLGEIRMYMQKRDQYV